MVATSRIRFVTDALYIGGNPTDPGVFAFEPGESDNNSVPVINSALIGDLSVNTIAIGDAMVTQGEFTEVTSNTTITAQRVANWQTFAEHDLSFKAKAGTLCYLRVLMTLIAQNNGSTLWTFARVLVDNTTTLIATHQPLTQFRMALSAFTATGSNQNINVKYQANTLNSSEGVGIVGRIDAGSRALSLLYKR